MTKKFVVVGKARSSAIFEQGEFIDLNVHFGGRRAAFRIATRFSDLQGTDVPLGIFVETRGEAESLSEAVEFFTNNANSILGIVALSVNVCIDNLEYELAFEATEGVTEREFFQNLLPDVPRPGPATRKTDKSSSENLIKAVISSSYDRRLFRAIAHYRKMLDYWCLEERLRCVTHAFVAVEALGPVALKHELNRIGLSKEEDLAKALGVNTTDPRWKNHLLGRVRQDIIFHGDRDVYKRAKSISDEFEHAFGEFDSLWRDVEEIVTRTAAHVRQAILELSGVSAEAKAALLAGPLSRPKGPPRLAHYFFGRLTGEGSELAAPGQAYPILRWRHRMTPCRDPGTGDVRVRVQTTIEPRLAPGISIRPERYEIWDGSTFTEPLDRDAILEDAKQNKMEITVQRKPEIVGLFAQDTPGTGPLISAVGWFITNCGALSVVLQAIVRTTIQDYKVLSRSPNLRMMARAIRREIEIQNRSEPELVSLLQEVDEIDAARRVVTDGVMLLGWEGEAVGPPKHAVMTKISFRGRNRARTLALSREEIEQVSEKAARVARALQAWLQAKCPGDPTMDEAR